jgi:hypothetical protein
MIIWGSRKIILAASVVGSLTGCSIGPSQSFIIGSAQARLDENAMCVLWPGGELRRRGETYFIPEQDRASLDPFVIAGLVKVVPAPALMQGSLSRATWFELSEAGAQRNARCLIDTNAYPQRYQLGFRIGRREAQLISRKPTITRHKCASTAWAEVQYRLLVDAEWFDASRFKTNFSAFFFYPATRTGTVMLPFYSVNGRQWGQGEIFGPHSNFVCFK